jgi:hypothetical protein
MATQAFEGNVRQYTAAKTTEVPSPATACTSSEFNGHDSTGSTCPKSCPCSTCWASPIRTTPAIADRARRFSAFYMGEDVDAPNYDP